MQNIIDNAEINAVDILRKQYTHIPQEDFDKLLKTASMKQEIGFYKINLSDLGFLVACMCIMEKDTHLLVNRNKNRGYINSISGLSKSLRLSRSSVIHHFEKLKEHGLISIDQYGRFILDENEQLFSRKPSTLPTLSEQDKKDISKEYEEIN